jgi:hypothetical protein
MVTSASRHERRRALDVLGLAESATEDEITRAWRGLVRETHPDLTGDSTPATVDRLRDLMWAHHTLTRIQPAGAVRKPVRVAVKPEKSTHDEPPIVAGPTRVHPAPEWRRRSSGGQST